MENWTKMHIRMLTVVRYWSILLPIILAVMFVLYTFYFIDELGHDIGFAIALTSTLLFFFFLLISRRDSSFTFFVIFLTMFSLYFYITLAAFSEPVQGFRRSYFPLTALLMVIIFFFIYFGRKLLVDSKGPFNGEEMDMEKRRTPVLVWLDNRPTSGEYNRAISLFIPWIVLPFFWYWIAVDFYDLPESAVTFLGILFWTSMGVVFISAVMFPLVSRQSILQLRNNGIWYSSGPSHLGQEYLTWKEIENMEFIRFVGINIAITRNIGTRWIRDLNKKTIRLIEHIMDNGWHKNLEFHVEDIINASSEIGMRDQDVESDDYYKNLISHYWAEVKMRDIQYLFLVGFALIFPFGLLMIYSSDSFISPMGYIIVALSLVLPVSLVLDNSKNYAINLCTGEEVFEQAKQAFEESLKELRIEFDSRDDGEDSRHYTLKTGTGYFSNMQSDVKDLGFGGRISLYCPNKKSREHLRDIFRVSDKFLDRAGLKIPPPVILR